MTLRSWQVATLLLCLTAAGALFRFYGLGHGAPYHFHADEMLALRSAELLRASPDLAAQSAKFFAYPVLPKEVLALVTNTYEYFGGPLNLATSTDAEVLMLLGRAVSATAATLTIPVVFLIGRRVAGDAAALLAGALMVASVVHIANARFFTADAILTLWCALALLATVHVAQRGRLRSLVAAGAAVGVALACKYTAAFLLLPLAAAHVVSPSRPGRGAGWRAWVRWIASGVLPVVIAIVVFLLVNPLTLEYPQKFVNDVREFIVGPNFRSGGPIWTAQFNTVSLRAYWFTNLLPWSLGPAFALWALVGVGWLFARSERGATVVASCAVFYYLVAAQTTTPFMRYVLPLTPVLAVAAAVLSIDLVRRGRRPRWALAATVIVLVTTWAWALAYMNVYRQPDARVAAARFIDRRIPEGANVLVEPSHNTPPMGSYLHEPALFNDYVGWGAYTVREDKYAVHTLDVYRHLYDGALSIEQKRRYIRDRLAVADYIVIDDTFEEFYQHLLGAEHAPVREYYQDLFAGRLQFRLIRDFQVSPALFGVEVPDGTAEMTFSLFDHPELFVFERIQPLAD